MITVDFDILRPFPGSRVLDIGCGTGRHAAALRDEGPLQVVAADTQPSDLFEARNRLHQHAALKPGGGSFTLTGADITDLPFADAAFDDVVCSEVLEHIADHRQAIRELARVLKPGGGLAVSVPRRWPETICWFLSRAYRDTPGGHLKIYTASKLIALMARNGFIHRKTHHAHALHTPFWWLKCLLGLDRDQLLPVRLYHRFLTWQIMDHPRLPRLLDRLLNPFIGKSVVLYFQKK
jgi:SAM-dependent methyltransferase